MLYELQPYSVTSPEIEAASSAYDALKAQGETEIPAQIEAAIAAGRPSVVRQLRDSLQDSLADLHQAHVKFMTLDMERRQDLSAFRISEIPAANQALAEATAVFKEAQKNKEAADLTAWLVSQGRIHADSAAAALRKRIDNANASEQQRLRHLAGMA